MRRFVLGFLVIFLFPYIVTLSWSGAINGLDGLSGLSSVTDRGRFRTDPDRQENTGRRRINLSDGKGYYDLEDYLPGLVARQIPAEYELEAIKAQAIIARTYIYRNMGDADQIDESDLNLEHMEEPELMKVWGEEHFPEYYKKIKRAVEETKGMILVYEDQCIEPLFHRVSAGFTRTGDELHPYLQAADSSFDLEAEGYISVTDWEPDEFVQRINAVDESAQVNAADVTDTVQIVKKDGSGYVEEIQVGSHIFSGEQVREALGLPSSAFSIRDHEGKIQITSRGIGHGLGLSQYGASRMAEDGKDVSEILKYYYKNVEIILSES